MEIDKENVHLSKLDSQPSNHRVNDDEGQQNTGKGGVIDLICIARVSGDGSPISSSIEDKNTINRNRYFAKNRVKFDGKRLDTT